MTAATPSIQPPGTALVVSDTGWAGRRPSDPVPAPSKVEHDERLVRRRFWSKLRANLHRVPFLEDLLAAYFCATDPATPYRVKALLLGALAYFVMPADAVPDWLLVAGFTDDAAVLAAAIQAVRTNLTPAHWTRARQALPAQESKDTNGAGAG